MGWTAALAAARLAWVAQPGRARIGNVSVERFSDLLVPQRLSRSVQIFGAEGIVGGAVTRRRRVRDVLGIPQPAIVTGELLGLHQQLIFGRSVMETTLKPVQRRQ